MNTSSTFVFADHFIQFPKELPSKILPRALTALEVANTVPRPQFSAPVVFTEIADRDPELDEVVWRLLIDDEPVRAFELCTVAPAGQTFPYMTAFEAKLELLGDQNGHRSRVPLLLADYLNGQLTRLGHRIRGIEVTWKRMRMVENVGDEVTEIVRFPSPIGYFEAGASLPLESTRIEPIDAAM